MTHRKPATVADLAWSKLNTRSIPHLRRWVSEQTSEEERVSCSAVWLRDELEKRDRQVTLEAERAAERPNESPTANEPDLKAERRAENARIRSEHAAQIQGRIDALAKTVEEAVAQHEKSLDLRWTSELLGSALQMPDGSSTTWGEATVEQHQLREAMFMKYMATNIEGAARHRRAIKDLTAAQALSLNDLVSVSEVA